ncbi:hypothetical protein VDQ16_11835 [Xanthomonas campestris pv. campestris]|uniref:Uncharacterized protein n=2 Tax=Xanthomonas TaxID=338 RepID=F0BC00_9XANT|nr:MULTISPECIES: hypothetical protein [Xanthomonas]MCC4606824.1 hypothetical protein [Xanthomonas campestris pv. zinniae]EGD07183.1 hypothetical protein XVE_4627 [Xanthomonas vesicatoria ATCC 35937]EGD09983.1 hypothetical protein XVE_1624 [Xanthomonas vesicatoria ATCC 35937]MCC8595780.1 hypothetical protein [Xanthomonas vesicatoria]MCC8607383.1 hypothetical protein [Xanthomonas vesicatoria]
MPDYKRFLTFETIGGKRGILLQCNKSEAVSQFFRLRPKGNKTSVSGNVTVWHPRAVDEKGKPKNIHFIIEDDGVYEVTNQRTLAGFYLFQKTPNGRMIYFAISTQEKDLLLAAPEEADLERVLRNLRQQ